MTLQAGTRLGASEVISPLGAGGMGEVYRGRDTRIGREVAIKILPADIAEDRDRLSRFQREAQTAGALNHPNLLTIHDVGTAGNVPYLISELLEGTTLRERIGGVALPPRKAVDYALQIANGLAATHEKGIVHRDLKPENIFVTRDGRVKILDFGLAKGRPPDVVATAAPTAAAETDPGTIAGTLGYMSPEQVRGDALDHRIDIFSFGAILYEMLSGQRAFRISSSIETMHAILHDHPPELSGSNPNLSPVLERLVMHCLEKSPDERFQSARDLVFDLENLSGISATSPAVVSPRGKVRRRALFAAVMTVIVAMAAAIGWFALAHMTRPAPPRFRRLTLRNATIGSARFVPGVDSVVFSGFTGTVSELFMVTAGRPEARSLGTPNARLLSISPSGELAVLTNPRHISGFFSIGTLARVPIGGGAPRELAENVLWAEWTPAGDDLLITRQVGGLTRLEMPLGKVLYSTAGWISAPRFSSDRQSIAFIDHATSGDDGRVVLLAPDLKKRVLSRTYTSAQGLAWAPDGAEIWFTAAESGGARALYAVEPGKRERLLVTAPNTLTLHDVRSDGTMLVANSNDRLAMYARTPSDTADRSLSWMDCSIIRDISADGMTLLFDEVCEAGRDTYAVYIRRIDGSPAVRLGEGLAQRFSPDGKWALSIGLSPPAQLFVYPIGPGQARQITHDDIAHTAAAWMPDGKRVVFMGYEPDHGSRVYVQDLDRGAPQPVTPEGVRLPLLVSPDGTKVCVRAGDGTVTTFPLSGGPAIVLSEIQRGEVPFLWTADGNALLFFRRVGAPVPVFRIDIRTHKVDRVKEIPAPSTPDGIWSLRLSQDGRTYAYSCFTDPGDLYLLDAIR